MSKTYPVTTRFDGTPIGQLILMDGVTLPEGANYSFEVGGVIVEKDGNRIKRFDLREISLIIKNEDNYEKSI